MASSSSEIVAEFPNVIRVYKNGRVERNSEPDFVPPSEDPETEVISKDIKIPPENIVSARLYKPKNTNEKLPLLIYIHGGGFCAQSAFSSQYQSYLNNLAAEANVIAASIEYRLAPEHPIPACYDDSWSAFKWLVSNSEEPWLRDHADLSRIFLAGDSAGANIAHDTIVRASKNGVKLVGMALVHPHFAGSQLLSHEKLWCFFCKYGTKGLDDPRLNPIVHPELLRKLTCNKILICTAGKDFLRERGWNYYEAIKKSGWSGEVEIYETEREDHAFHLHNQLCENAAFLMKKMAAFIK